MISRRDWVPFEISASGRVDHVDECTSLSEIVEELVPQTAALMSLWNETGDIKQLDGDETRASFTRRVVRFRRRYEKTRTRTAVETVLAKISPNSGTGTTIELSADVTFPLYESVIF